MKLRIHIQEKINDEIKPEYRLQMLQQQYTCDIHVCDFLETMIVDSECSNGSTTAYKNTKEMINDTLDTSESNWREKIHNHNIPVENLSSEGKEKGVILNFKRYRNLEKSDFDMKTLVYPITGEYSISEILNGKRTRYMK